ncbi:hypothetical protein VP01_1486g2 [Puccinia sorghi]|uniref:Uncharacterized protein n=1 Tax=Puccinia sorghi TaxID=27349 RepID=A0A0L6VLB3_9BASI|nr:hypothetical protein VP01_1486g2 [Puccinia sorghi]
MHSNKELTVDFVYNHSNKYNKKAKGEVKDHSDSNQADLFSKDGEHWKTNQKSESGNIAGRHCKMGYHNPKQNSSNNSASCWHLNPNRVPEWWREAQAKFEAVKKSNCFMSHQAKNKGNMYTLPRYKGAPLYLARQCVHIACTLGLVSLVILWVENGKTMSKIILDSGSSCNGQG